MKPLASRSALFLLLLFLLTAGTALLRPSSRWQNSSYDERGNVIRQTPGHQRRRQDRSRDLFITPQGQTDRVEQDLNFDGKADVFIYYESGKPARQEIASKKRRPASRHLAVFEYEKGEIERGGQDTQRSGKPKMWIYYENGQPVRVRRR